MKRKEFLKRLTFLGGGMLLIPAVLFNACKNSPERRRTLSRSDIPLLDEIGETIIPATSDSPGAKAAKIGRYMLVMVNDCFNPVKQLTFLDGLNTFDALCLQRYKSPFMHMNALQKLELLKQLQIEATALNIEQQGSENPLIHYFDMFKNLTVSGYFTSEIGATEARQYVQIPGKHEACIAYKKGDRPWAI